MLKKIKYLFLVAPCLLASCNTSKQTSKDQCTLHINNIGCTYKGLQKTYNVGDKVEIIFTPDGLYKMPTSQDIKVYGSENYTYDSETGIMDITLDSNTGIDVIAIPKIGGRKSCFGEVREFCNSHRPEDPSQETIPFTKVNVEWNFPTYDAQDKSKQNDKELLTVFLCSLLGFEDIYSFPYDIKHDKVTTEIEDIMDCFFGYFTLETGLYNNRILVDRFNDEFTINEEEEIAECLINNATSIATKDSKVFSPVIITIDKRDLIKSFELILPRNSVTYKNLILGTPGCIKMTYLEEGQE